MYGKYCYVWIVLLHVQINVMQKELIELQPQLIQTSKETEELIVVIEKERIEVREVKVVVEIDEAAAAKSAAESQAIKVRVNHRIQTYILITYRALH